jgi:hypothetical protein
MGGRGSGWQRESKNAKPLSVRSTDVAPYAGPSADSSVTGEVVIPSSQSSRIRNIAACTTSDFRMAVIPTR